jgi:uncharacterized protein YecE (DUF72 family)
MPGAPEPRPQKTGRALIGVSGWSYKEWAGSFYPEGLPKKRQLEYVAGVFPTVEVNGSFYSLQSPKTYRAWYEQTQRGFRFALKGSQFITHNKKLKDVEAPLANFFASGVLALEEKLGPIVWQLPATQRFDAERVAAFLRLLPRTTTEVSALAELHDERVKDPLITSTVRRPVLHAFEARHESFFTNEAVELLRRERIALVVSDSGDWERVEEPTAGFIYVRLHGSPRTYRSQYKASALDEWAAKLSAWMSGGDPEDARRVTNLPLPRHKTRDVYVYFDNDAWGHAPHDALALIRKMEASHLGEIKMRKSKVSKLGNP